MHFHSHWAPLIKYLLIFSFFWKHIYIYGQHVVYYFSVHYSSLLEVGHYESVVIDHRRSLCQCLIACGYLLLHLLLLVSKTVRIIDTLTTWLIDRIRRFNTNKLLRKRYDLMFVLHQGYCNLFSFVKSPRCCRDYSAYWCVINSTFDFSSFSKIRI